MKKSAKMEEKVVEQGGIDGRQKGRVAGWLAGWLAGGSGRAVRRWVGLSGRGGDEWGGVKDRTPAAECLAARHTLFKASGDTPRLR